MEPVLNIQALNFSNKDAKPTIGSISLKSFMQDLVKDLRPLLNQKRLEIIVNDQWTRGTFMYDVDYLHKIFLGIISNAVKNSFEEGKIIINLIQTNRGDLKVQIADNGNGLPYKDQKIIREYYQSSKSPTAKSREIDLLYVKDLIDKLGGSIVFESSKDQGTTFTIILKNYNKAESVTAQPIIEELPVEVVIAEKPSSEDFPLPKVEKKIEIVPEKEAVVPPLVPSEKKKILIAEDNVELRKVIAGFLRKLGDVYEARNGEEAFEMAGNLDPDVIIADFEMPGMDGLALNKALRNDPVLARIPLYLMIAETDNLQLPESSGNELLNIIKKPVNIDALLEMLADKLEVSLVAPSSNTNLSARNSRLLKGAGNDDPYMGLQNFILQNIRRTSFSAEELATVMGITPVSLTSRLRERFGLTPEEYVIKTKLEFAKELIANGNFDLAEVSRLSGFQNKDLFFSAFKKHHGFMPGTIIEK